jgi:hypothetical protein
MAGGTPRAGDGKFIRNIKTAQRDADAAALRAKGWTFQRIANELGYASKGKAHEAVQRAFAEVPYEHLEDARRLDLERIDRLVDEAWQVMERQHVAVSNGHVVRRRVGDETDEFGEKVLDADGKPLGVYEDVLDDGPLLAAIDRIAKLLERRAKIVGYEAPVRSRVEVITEDAIDAEIARLEEKLGERGPDRAGAP